jgi:ubiquinone/menaquinone biosynthesis C-methylase UbiE
MLQTKEQIKNTYNEIGKTSGGYHRGTWGPLQRFLDKVDSDLLDVGAGNCDRTRQVLARGIKLYAVDFAEEMLKHAPKEAVTIVADATKIPLKKKFKYITAIAVIHHMPTEKDRIAFLKEVKRLLKTGGEALITAWRVDKKGDRMIKWGAHIERYYHFFSEKELHELLKKAKISNYELTKVKVKRANYIIKITN